MRKTLLQDSDIWNEDKISVLGVQKNKSEKVAFNMSLFRKREVICKNILSGNEEKL